MDGRLEFMSFFNRQIAIIAYAFTNCTKKNQEKKNYKFFMFPEAFNDSENQSIKYRIFEPLENQNSNLIRPRIEQYLEGNLHIICLVFKYEMLDKKYQYKVDNLGDNSIFLVGYAAYMPLIKNQSLECIGDDFFELAYSIMYDKLSLAQQSDKENSVIYSEFIEKTSSLHRDSGVHILMPQYQFKIENSSNEEQSNQSTTQEKETPESQSSAISSNFSSAEKSSKWAPIVYGRTYTVDFRFLAIPNGIEEAEKDWFRKYIQVSMRSAEKLRDKYRWSIFRSTKFCVVGLTCMSNVLSKNFTNDFQNRATHVFVGYVTKSRFPDIPPMEKNLFKPLYKFVSEKWEDINRLNYTQTDYTENLNYTKEKLINTDVECFDGELNTNHNQVFLWTDSEQNDKKLWKAVSECQSPVSLCLGLARRKDATDNSPFLNVTIVGKDISNEPEKIDLLPPKNDLTNSPPPPKNNFSWLNTIRGFFDGINIDA